MHRILDGELELRVDGGDDGEGLFAHLAVSGSRVGPCPLNAGAAARLVLLTRRLVGELLNGAPISTCMGTLSLSFSEGADPCGAAVRVEGMGFDARWVQLSQEQADRAARTLVKLIAQVAREDARNMWVQGRPDSTD